MSDKIIQLNEDLIKHDLKDLVRNSVEETLNAREFDSCIIKTVLAGRIKPVLFLSNFLH